MQRETLYRVPILEQSILSLLYPNQDHAPHLIRMLEIPVSDGPPSARLVLSSLFVFRWQEQIRF